MSQTSKESLDGTINEYELILYVFIVIKLSYYLKAIKVWDLSMPVSVELIAHEIQSLDLAEGAIKAIEMEKLDKS